MKFNPYKKHFVIRIIALFIIVSSFLVVFASPIQGHLHHQAQELDQTKAQLNVMITKPLVGHLYINDEDRGNTTIGITRIIGSITIEANVSCEEGTIDRVEFIIDGIVRNTTNHPPYTWFWKDTYVGAATIKVRAFDTGGNETSKSISVRVLMINEVEMTMIRLLCLSWTRLPHVVMLK